MGANAQLLMARSLPGTPASPQDPADGEWGRGGTQEQIQGAVTSHPSLTRLLLGSSWHQAGQCSPGCGVCLVEGAQPQPGGTSCSCTPTLYEDQVKPCLHCLPIKTTDLSGKGWEQ